MGEHEGREVTGDAQRMDAPNQQAVRPDGSGPSDEGEGGSTDDERVVEPLELEEPADENKAAAPSSSLDEMTKAELLEHAQAIGVSPANNNMTKEELREAVDRHTGG